MGSRTRGTGPLRCGHLGGLFLWSQRVPGVGGWKRLTLWGSPKASKERVCPWKTGSYNSRGLWSYNASYNQFLAVAGIL